MKNMQKKVTQMGVGSAGTIAKGLHSYFMAYHAPAKDDSVCVGCFVQLDNDKEHIKGASGVQITGAILGVALKDQFINSVDNTHIYPANTKIVTYMTKGAVFIETKSPAKKGQYVFLKNDNGTLVFDDNDTKADHTYTGFRVVLGTGNAVNTDAGFDIIAIMSDN